MKKNIIKTVIAMVFILGAIIGFESSLSARIEPDKCAGGSCTFEDTQFNWKCTSCCPEGKTPDCGPTGCTCF